MAEAHINPTHGVGGTLDNALIKAPAWRSASMVVGAAIGLMCSFPSLFNGALSFFLVQWSQEFGWGRGQTSSAVVLSMLGMTIGAPLVGRLVDRIGAERVVGVSVLLFAALLYAMSYLPGSLLALAATCFAIGLAGAGTTMVSYIGIRPLWFDKRLGLALGVAGVGAGVGVAMAAFLASTLISRVGWRGALVAMAAVALIGGALAYLLIRLRKGERPPLAREVLTSAAEKNESQVGHTFSEACRTLRFWLLFVATLVVVGSVLGLAIHLVALLSDRGFSPQQSAAGVGIAGASAVVARIVVGAMLDRWRAPIIAAGTMALGGCGLLIISNATTYPLIAIAIALCGALMGAESDLIPYMVRRYFGMRSFGTVFGVQFSAFALGSMLGPIVYGLTFDRIQSYTPVAFAAGVACFVCALAMLFMGPYRYSISQSSQAQEA